MYSKNYFKENLGFILGWFIFTIIISSFLVVYNKADSFILLNAWHSGFLTGFFKICTWLGDGWFVISLSVLLSILKKKQLCYRVISSYALSGIIVQILKYFFSASRPKLYFETHQLSYPYFLDNISLHTIHSFPSGHTASAFALAAAISFSLKHKTLSIFFLIGAILIGYSRIYLGQHFPEDVIAGAAIGIFSTILSYAILEKIFRLHNSGRG